MKQAAVSGSGAATIPEQWRAVAFLAYVGGVLAICSAGCTAAFYRHNADRVAYDIIQQKQCTALGRTEPFMIESPADTLRRRLLLDQQLPSASPASLGTRDIEPIKQWPDKTYLEQPAGEDPLVDALSQEPVVRLTLNDALQIAAHESREYQTQKETVFRTALQLDLEQDAFRRTWSGVLTHLFQADLEQEVALDDKGHTDLQTVAGNATGAVGQLSQEYKNGLTFTGALGVDLVNLLTQNRLYSRGIYADISATLPLLRGSGEFVVTEPLTQAERNVVYALYTFEQFRRTFAVSVASDYLDVLQQLDRVRNAEDNYRSLMLSTRRAVRLANAGRSSQIEVDQSLQRELDARRSWVAAQETYDRRLDAFKVSLGLPADAALELDRAELEKLGELAAKMASPEVSNEVAGEAPAADAPVELQPPGQGRPGPYEIDADEAIRMALRQRPDLRVAVGEIDDAQRTVAVAADQLRADLTLLGTGAAGARRTIASAGQADAILRPDEGSYSALLTLDLPLERTAEQDAYRTSLIGLEQSVRAVQSLEDQIKLGVRARLGELLEAREAIQIETTAVEVATRRVASTQLFLEAGRVQMRDYLDAQDALVLAQNSLTAALVNYRLAELSLQRDMGVLEVNETGLWREYTPEVERD
jgi:outer membrane protein TolC